MRPSPTPQAPGTKAFIPGAQSPVTLHQFQHQSVLMGPLGGGGGAGGGGGGGKDDERNARLARLLNKYVVQYDMI